MNNNIHFIKLNARNGTCETCSYNPDVIENPARKHIDASKFPLVPRCGKSVTDYNDLDHREVREIDQRFRGCIQWKCRRGHTIAVDGLSYQFPGRNLPDTWAYRQMVTAQERLFPDGLTYPGDLHVVDRMMVGEPEVDDAGYGWVIYQHGTHLMTVNTCDDPFNTTMEAVVRNLMTNHHPDNLHYWFVNEGGMLRQTTPHKVWEFTQPKVRGKGRIRWTNHCHECLALTASDYKIPARNTRCLTCGEPQAWIDQPF